MNYKAVSCRLCMPFLAHKQLWTKDICRGLEQFLETATMRSDDGGELPSLQLFADRIQQYKEMEKVVQALPAQTFVGWLKVDSQPIKKALLAWVNKWADAHTSHLEDFIKSELQNLLAFIEQVLTPRTPRG